MKNILFILCLLFISISQAQTVEVFGTVFHDKNENGIRDASEKSLKRVLISNGKDLIQTDREGKFRLSAEKGASIFPILPPGYRFVNKDNWWHTFVKGTEEGNSVEVDFALRRSPVKGDFRALVIGDLQVEGKEELGYADRSILAEMRNRKDYDFSIFLGDLVNDEPAMFPAVKTMINELQQPAWPVYGNHDRNTDQPYQYQHLDYSSHFGPATYAFYHEEVLFVVLNTIEPVGKYGYDGKYGAADLEFLKNLLEKTDKDQLLVISQHIPLPMIKNQEALLELVKKQKKVLLLSGHTHTVFQNFRETPQGGYIHELTAGAVSGHWWTGQKDWQGVPLALMQDGTPRGYFEIDFFTRKKKTDYLLRYKGVGLVADKQLSIWFGNPGAEISQTISKDNPDIFVNIYAGSPETVAEMRIDDRQWEPLERVRMMDPHISRIKELQDEKRYPDQTSRRSPYLSRSSSHIWKGGVKVDLKPGLHKLEVWARDKRGLDHREAAWFWVEN